jgi:polyisoprenoid-binding protein YceI
VRCWFMTMIRLRLMVALAAATIVGGPSVRAQAADAKTIDVLRSKLTIFVYKSGFFSAFADNHIINAPIASGTFSATAPLSITMTVQARNLEVVDPDLAADKRREVQTRMLGPEVLDVERYPTMRFASERIEATGSDAWKVAGNLTIHGQTRPIAVAVAASNGAYRGHVRIRQRDFGITPISIAGGTVKVKDEIVVEFVIAGR